jgi:RNA polymerase sigma-70 factor (ECF subfamily)
MRQDPLRMFGETRVPERFQDLELLHLGRCRAQLASGTFEGWLHRITTNLFLDMVRRRQRIRFDALPEDTERLPGTAPSPEQVYSDTHLDPQIQAALDALSPEFRVAVVLCDIEGLTYEEIAATLGIKLGTVRSRIHRGRSQLRAALAHLAPRPV